MHLAELGHAQGQVAVALDALGKQRDGAGAVHGLKGKHPLVLGGGGEHRVAIVEPVAGGFPQPPVHHVGGIDLDVVGFVLARPHVGDQLLEQGPAPGVPEHRSGCAVVEMEEIELGAELAVVTLAGFLKAGQVGGERPGVGPASAVNALQHGLRGVAAPIGTRHLGQLEGLEAAGGGHVGAPAQVLEVALAIEGQGFAFRDGVDQLRLVVLALLFEVGNGLVTGKLAPGDWQVGGGQFVHAGFDQGQIVGGEGALEGEVVEEALFDDRADGDLGAREQLLHGHGQQVGAGVTQDRQAFGAVRGDQAEPGVPVDAEGGVDGAVIDTAGEGGPGEAVADGGGDVGHGWRVRERALAAIRQGDAGHGA